MSLLKKLFQNNKRCCVKKLKSVLAIFIIIIDTSKETTFEYILYI